MKIIMDRYEKICRVLCMLHDMDGEYLDINRTKILPNIDDEILNLQFNSEKNLTFIERLKKVKDIKWRQKNSGIVSGLLLSLDQLKDLFTLLYNDLIDNNILSEQDKEYINNLKKIKFQKKENCDEIVIYSIDEDSILYSVGLSLSIIPSEINDEMFFNEFELNWIFPDNLKSFVFGPCSRDYIFKNERYYFDECDIRLTKSQTIELLAVINYVVNNPVIDKGCLCFT